MTNNLNVDINDPSVRRLLGEEAPLVATGRKRELVHLAGDPDHGLRSTIHLDHGKHEVKVFYRDFVLTVDVYRMDREPMKIHLICPRCRNLLTIPQDRKQIDFDPRAGNPENGGRLNVEAFECTWEINGDQKASLAGGLNLCRWRVAIDNNVAKDA